MYTINSVEVVGRAVRVTSEVEWESALPDGWEWHNNSSTDWSITAVLEPSELPRDLRDILALKSLTERRAEYVAAQKLAADLASKIRMFGEAMR